MATKRIYGWIPSVPDHRDKMYALNAMQKDAAGTLPASTNNRTLVTWVLNQLALGSCTANAASSFVRILMLLCGVPDFLSSRLAIYYEERKAQKTVSKDSGATITECFKVLSKQGTFPETEWPYDITKFKKAPPKASVKEGLKTVVESYQRLDNTNLIELKTCLAAKFPIEFGFSVYESFESDEVAKTGLVPMPGKNERLLGGHANVIIDYDDNKVVHGHKGAFYVLNSWGEEWGLKGFYWIPYAYLTNANLADDFWTARLVS